MPSKNIVKNYFPGGYYHVYNRAVEKRVIFLDSQDCNRFLHYIKLYLSSPEAIKKLSDSNNRLSRFIKVNLHTKVELLAFAIMPNHYHFLLKNVELDGIKSFMQRLTTAYVMYFNNKYDRVGPLFQNRYKAAYVSNDSYLLHLTRYIHNNATKINSPKLNFSDYSSFLYYLGQKEAEWIKPSFIMDSFKETYSPAHPEEAYRQFVRSDIQDSISALNDNELLLENECT